MVCKQTRQGTALSIQLYKLEWDEIGIFDLPAVNDSAWVIFSGFSVESDLFKIDIDTNSGDFIHTVLWELALFDGDFVPTYEPEIELSYSGIHASEGDNEDDIIIYVDVSDMNPEIAYMVELHVHYPGIPYVPSDFDPVYFSQENITVGLSEKQFQFTINRSEILENMLFCIDANLLYVSNQTHLTGQGDCYDLSNFYSHTFKLHKTTLMPRTRLVGSKALFTTQTNLQTGQLLKCWFRQMAPYTIWILN